MNVENLRLNDLIPYENNTGEKAVLINDNIKAEIERVKTAIEKTNSPHLKRDYEKYLQKLYKRLKRGE